jgi:hypothetical protein
MEPSEIGFKPNNSVSGRAAGRPLQKARQAQRKSPFESLKKWSWMNSLRKSGSQYEPFAVDGRRYAAAEMEGSKSHGQIH